MYIPGPRHQQTRSLKTRAERNYIIIGLCIFFIRTRLPNTSQIQLLMTIQVNHLSIWYRNFAITSLATKCLPLDITWRRKNFGIPIYRHTEYMKISIRIKEYHCTLIWTKLCLKIFQEGCGRGGGSCSTSPESYLFYILIICFRIKFMKVWQLLCRIEIGIFITILFTLIIRFFSITPPLSISLYSDVGGGWISEGPRNERLL